MEVGALSDAACGKGVKVQTSQPLIFLVIKDVNQAQISSGYEPVSLDPDRRSAWRAGAQVLLETLQQEPVRNLRQTEDS